jgi:hypothetical protein
VWFTVQDLKVFKNFYVLLRYVDRRYVGQKYH